MCDDNQDLDGKAVETFQGYLQIPTITTDTDYVDAVNYLKCVACSIKLDTKVVNVAENRPVLIMTYPGSVACSESIVLNSHMDVAAVDEDKWAKPPFSGELDALGRIYGRGTQDMKINGIQYLEAVRRLKKEGIQLKRNVIIIFTPDKESDSQQGMKLFIEKCEFQQLNVGLWLDESSASACSRAFVLYNGEKHKYVVDFVVEAPAVPPWQNSPDSATKKLGVLLGLINDYQQCQIQLEKCNPDGAIAIAVTEVKSEADANMPPNQYKVRVEMMLPSDVCLDRFKATLDDWVSKVGEGCSQTEVLCEILDKPTPLDNRYLAPIRETINEMGYELQIKMNPTTTDARYIRSLGLPAFGLSTLNGVTTEMHGQNEYVEKDKFLTGIEVYYNLLQKLGNLEC